jgi:hypothetical protein
MVAPRLQGLGVSRRMLCAVRNNARRLGFALRYAPLRPTEKDKEPLTPFADYVQRRRADGLPGDAWIRTHIRAGADVVKIAPRSMVVAGTITEWRAWTGLDFHASGLATVPGALCPIHVSLEQNHAVYVEPNLWLRQHRLTNDISNVGRRAADRRLACRGGCLFALPRRSAMGHEERFPRRRLSSRYGFRTQSVAVDD